MSFPSCHYHHDMPPCSSHHVVPIMLFPSCPEGIPKHVVPIMSSIMSFPSCRSHHVVAIMSFPSCLSIMYVHLDRLRYSEDEIIASKRVPTSRGSPEEESPAAPRGPGSGGRKSQMRKPTFRNRTQVLSLKMPPASGAAQRSEKPRSRGRGTRAQDPGEAP